MNYPITPRPEILRNGNPVKGTQPVVTIIPNVPDRGERGMRFSVNCLICGPHAVDTGVGGLNTPDEAKAAASAHRLAHLRALNEEYRSNLAADVKEAMAQLDGSTEAVLTLMTGLSAEEIAECGGVQDPGESGGFADLVAAEENEDEDTLVWHKRKPPPQASDEAIADMVEKMRRPDAPGSMQENIDITYEVWSAGEGPHRIANATIKAPPQRGKAIADAYENEEPWLTEWAVENLLPLLKDDERGKCLVVITWCRAEPELIGTDDLLDSTLDD